MSKVNADRGERASFRGEQVRPVDLKIVREKAELRIRWADGAETVYPLTYLRKHCPCAGCRTERAKKPELLPVLAKAPASAIGVSSAQPLGNYALQIVWSDGHSTGIYDYRYLREIAPSAKE